MATKWHPASGNWGIFGETSGSREAKKAEIFQDQGDAVLRGLLDISPPLDHKYRKLRKCSH